MPNLSLQQAVLEANALIVDIPIDPQLLAENNIPLPLHLKCDSISSNSRSRSESEFESERENLLNSNDSKEMEIDFISFLD